MSDVVGRTCPFCQTPFKPVDNPVYCSKCGLPHHARCWQENGACTTFGCDGLPIDVMINVMGNTNNRIDLTLDEFTCPHCQTNNPISSRFCIQCGCELSQSNSQTYNQKGVICKGCGSTNASSALHCSRCGANLQQTATVDTYTPGQQASAHYPQGPAVVTNVPNYLWQAIFCTVCCCLPGGIVAIVYAAQVNGKLQTGDYNGAIAASNNAKTWCWISAGLGLLFAAFYGMAGLGR